MFGLDGQPLLLILDAYETAMILWGGDGQQMCVPDTTRDPALPVRWPPS